VVTMADDSVPTSRRRHVARLVLFAGLLLGMFYLVAVARVIDVEEVRRAVSATGPAAPLTYAVVSAAGPAGPAREPCWARNAPTASTR
jgi:uncharacterized membrane protein YdjX (TVP38/TMEM64 family)